MWNSGHFYSFRRRKKKPQIKKISLSLSLSDNVLELQNKEKKVQKRKLFDKEFLTYVIALANEDNYLSWMEYCD